MKNLMIRDAQPQDVDEILDLIMQIAIQEQLSDNVKITKKELYSALFNDNPKVFVSVVEHPISQGTLAGFALYWIDFPTWLGRHGIYIEDICVTTELRGQGIGISLMSYLADKCIKEEYARLSWWVKNDNRSAISFYETIGADIKKEYTVRHLSGSELHSLAKKFKQKI